MSRQAALEEDRLNQANDSVGAARAHEKRERYYTLMVYEDADATLLRLFEVRHDSNHAATDIDYFVVCSASWRVRLSWCSRSIF